MIQLFKEGTSHLYKGITCETMLVNEFGYEHYLENGWVLNPNDLYKEKEESKETTVSAVKPEGKTSISPSKASPKSGSSTKK